MKQKTKLANEKDAAQKEIDDKLIEDLMDKKKMFKAAQKRVQPMAEPRWAIATAFFL